LAQAGLRDKAPHRSKGKGQNAKRSSNGLSIHALRHTAVSLLKDAGIPEAVVMELVGHESKAMSAHYTHVGNEALAIDRHPDGSYALLDERLGVNRFALISAFSNYHFPACAPPST
jgi:integrase